MAMSLDWIIFISILLLLAYTLIVIREEKSSFKENAKEKKFNQFKFFVPSWWGTVEDTDTLLRYQRLDTRYEWEAKFDFVTYYDKTISIEEQFKERIHTLNVLFDPDSGVIMNPSDFNKHQQVINKRCSIVRIEGTATQDEIHRRYIDAFLVRDHKTQTALFAVSTSSILNGLVEGPYFEDVMLNFEIN